jgi:alcohol dehydrogenase (cytochrome c)
VKKFLAGFLVACGAIGAPMVPAQTPDPRAQPAGTDWPLTGGDWLNSRYSALTQITPANVKQLRGAWIRDFPGASSRATPVVQNGTIFIPAATNLFAIDGKTGEIKWRYQPDRGSFSTQGASTGDGMVFVGLGPDVVAVDQKTGTLAWRYTPADRPVQGVTGPPTYVNGFVLIGVSQGDSYLRGRIVGLDAKTGKEVWRWWVIPGPGEKGHETWPANNDSWKYGGGAVWMVPAVDAELGLVYLASGNPTPQWGGELRGGDNLFTECVIALDIKTGRLRWYYQLIKHDIWEMDNSTPLVLYDATVGGRTRKAVAAMRTDGYLFLLDRATGEPVFPVEQRAVPQDAFLKTAPTQPFPVGADKMGPSAVEPGMVPAGFRLGRYFEPIRVDMVNFTTPTPSARFAPLSYSPQTKLFYATGCVNQWWMRRAEDPWFFQNTFGRVPGAKRWGLITAFDSRTNKIAWEKRVPWPVCGGGGTMATATGLVFHPEPDGHAQAYDGANGNLLWEFQTGILPPMGPISPYAGAMVSYAVDGEQYVAYANGRQMWAFKLGGAIAARPAPVPYPTIEPFRTEPQAGTRVESGIVASQTIEHMNYKKDWQYEWAVNPERVRAKAGSTITWANTGKMPHTFTAEGGQWTTGPIAPGQSRTVKFDKAGEFTYTCREHPWTIGQVIID